MSKQFEILLADDDLGFVKALTVRLEQEGYKVTVARDGYNAVARAVEQRPDLMILDIHMPAGDGFTVQERKDKMSTLVNVPVIYVTGDKSEQTKVIAEQFQAAGIIHKPFEFEQLNELIGRALGSRAA